MASVKRNWDSFTDDEFRRSSTFHTCLEEILAPNLRKVIATEFQDWYNLLTKPPIDIDKQTPDRFQRVIFPSTFRLRYENINGNDVHEYFSPAYDCAVRDPLSLAKLFMPAHTAKSCAGFDETMNHYAVLEVMCEATPFVNCGAAIHARNIKSEYLYKRANQWTNAEFNRAIEELRSLVKSINLSDPLKEEVCDELERIRREESYSSWEKVSIAYKEKFEKLIDLGLECPSEILEINGVRVCLKEEFLIGTGGQSMGVYVGLGRDGSEKAVKLFFKATHGQLAEKEKELLVKCETKDLSHVVRYWYFDDTSHNMFAFLIMELCEETLERFVDRSSREDLVKVAPEITQQILKGLADLHHKPYCILHRDVKPLNILRNAHGRWLLADFGIGRILSDDQTTHISVERGTKKWKAIESCSESGSSDDGNVRYKAKSDIQVTGMVAFYILTKGKHPFGEADQVRANLLAANPVNLKMLDGLPFAKDLISWMLSHKPGDRPSAEEALHHPYLKSKEEQFNLLCGMGNYVKRRDANSDVVRELNRDKEDWKTRMDSDVLKYLSYDTLKSKRFRYISSWADCLRLIRNVKEHWKDCPRTEPEAMKVGDPQQYFINLFPDLVLRVYKSARSSVDLKELSGLKEYFKG